MQQSTISREFTFTQQDFRYLAQKVHAHTGIVLAEHKEDMVYSRLTRRLRQLNITSFHDYCELLESEEGVSELTNFVNAVTTNLTSFFREDHHFTHLEKAALPAVRDANSKTKRLRIWSAGCSNGSEPYSIAMVLHGFLKSQRGWDARILATDIDSNMIAFARAGRYPASVLQHIPPGYRSHTTTDERDDNQTIQMNPELCELIAFNQLNLLESWPMKGPFDIIFCRNVVIYFDVPTQIALFNRYADLLQPGGWLYIGHSESLYKISDRFQLIGKTIYQKQY